jgi:hypothetical protein
VRAASGLPQFVSESFDLRVSEGYDAVTGCSCMSVPIGVAKLIRGLTGLLMARQVILLSMLFGDFIRVRRTAL